MGKKYIIELESGTHIFVLGPEGIVHIGEPDVVYETVDGMQIGDAVINAKPYTEPDLDAIRNESYEKGVQDTKQHWVDAPRSCAYKLGYENGLNDAWEAARKIGSNSMCSLKEMGFDFSQCVVSDYNPSWFVVKNYSASEAIEKIRQYEQEQEEQINVGDEVIPRETEYDTMIVTRLWKDDYDSDCIDAIGFDGRISSFLVSRVSKTGKHYELAAVLAKMKEES